MYNCGVGEYHKVGGVLRRVFFPNTFWFLSETGASRVPRLPTPFI